MDIEKLRKYLTKKVTHAVVYKSRWSYSGTNFVLREYYTFENFVVTAEFACDIQTLSARLARSTSGNCPEVIGESVFTGNGATSACIEWVVNMLVETYSIIQERIAPFAANKRAYDFRLNMPLKVQGG